MNAFKLAKDAIEKIDEHEGGGLACDFIFDNCREVRAICSAVIEAERVLSRYSVLAYGSQFYSNEQLRDDAIVWLARNRGVTQK